MRGRQVKGAQELRIIVFSGSALSWRGVHRSSKVLVVVFLKQRDVFKCWFYSYSLTLIININI
jgi:hypothetical protein